MLFLCPNIVRFCFYHLLSVNTSPNRSCASSSVSARFCSMVVEQRATDPDLPSYVVFVLAIADLLLPALPLRFAFANCCLSSILLPSMLVGSGHDFVPHCRFHRSLSPSRSNPPGGIGFVRRCLGPSVLVGPGKVCRSRMSVLSPLSRKFHVSSASRRVVVLVSRPKPSLRRRTAFCFRT